MTPTPAPTIQDLPIGRLIAVPYGPKTIGVGEPGGPSLFRVRCDDRTRDEMMSILGEIIGNHNSVVSAAAESAARAGKEKHNGV